MSNKLIQLLEIEAERIKLEFNEASISGKGTPSDVSDRREPHVSAFIKKYFPFPYRVAKGRIIDSFDNESNSIDCILLNPSHPYTLNPNDKEYSLLLADGVDAAVEIKPKLEGEEIIIALNQVQSVKKLRRKNCYLLGDYSKEKEEYSKQITSFIFSSTTYKDIKLLLEKIVDYYVVNRVPKNEQFDYIIVNNRCIVYNVRFESSVNNGFNPKKEGLTVVSHRNKTLYYFLYRLNTIYPSVLNICETVVSNYLKMDVDDFKEIEWFDDINQKLLSIN